MPIFVDSSPSWGILGCLGNCWDFGFGDFGILDFGFRIFGVSDLGFSDLEFLDFGFWICWGLVHIFREDFKVRACRFSNWVKPQ